MQNFEKKGKRKVKVANYLMFWATNKKLQPILQITM